MKEVKNKRYAGPFEEIPYKDDLIQSPIGLVLKDGGKDTRLIFHLSHPRNNRDSVNFNTPESLCKVKYVDFDQAIRLCLKEGKSCTIGKTDFHSAFRVLGLSKGSWRYLIMQAHHPVTGKTYFFVDKCLPFGAAISCSHFQRVLNAIAFLVRWRTRLQTGVDKPLVNYLDDFLFVALLKWLCDQQMAIFARICAKINFPIGIEKTVEGCTSLVLLGLLIDTVKQLILLPREKIIFGHQS